MRELDRYVMKAAEVLIYHLEKVSPQDENVEMLYTKRLKPILQEILNGKIRAPSKTLEGYSYYFSPDPHWSNWGIYDRFPDLGSAVSFLSNLLNYSDDEALFLYHFRQDKFTSQDTIQLVSIHTHADNPADGFLVRDSDIASLKNDAKMISTYLSLKETSDFISDVEVPPNTKIQVGIIALPTNFTLPINSAIQYQLLEQIPTSCFKNTRPLD